MLRKCFWRKIAGMIALASGLSGFAIAQTVPPHITAVTQSGGQRGTTIELTITGVHIGEGTALILEGPGVTVESVTPQKPAPKEPPKPEGTLTARIHLAADAEPGWRALRVLTPYGPSDVGHFAIGAWTEVAEKEPNNTPAQAQELHLPVTVVGRLDPAEDVDCFRFHADTGQVLVFDVWAARIDSALEPVLSVQDESGREIALSSDFRDRDQPMVFTPPKAGSYVLRLHDLRYQGSPNHTYRLTVGAIPYVTGVLPLGGAPGAALDLRLSGFNLGSVASCHVNLPSDPLSETFTRTFALPTGLSNPVLLTTGTFPEQTEREPNDTVANAQTLPVPATVNGRLYHEAASSSADVDCYRFHATKGQRLTLEVMARRLGSPLDSVLTVLDINGKELASNDDALGADSRLDFTVPDTGDYIARLTDLNQRQGPDFVYRLSIFAPQPDFRLSFAPDRLAIGQGGSIPLSVTAARENGFDGEIALTLDGLPNGVRVLGEPKIRAGKSETLLVLTAASDSPVQASAFQVTGVAVLNGNAVRHRAQSQREEYARRDDRIERSTPPSVLPMAAVALPPDMTVTAAPDHLTLAPGKSVEIKVKITRKAGFTAKVPLALLGLPSGVTATTPEIAEKQTEATITLKIEGNAPVGESTLLVIGKAVQDELHFVPHSTPPLVLTITN